MKKIASVLLLLPLLTLCGCGGEGQKERYVQIGKESVLEMLESVSDTTKVLLDEIEQSRLNTSAKYELMKMTTALLQQQNVAYAALCAGELSQAMREVEEVRVTTVRIQARLEYEKGGLGTNGHSETTNYGTAKLEPRTTKNKYSMPTTPRSVGSTPKSGSGGSTASTSSSSGSTKTGNGEKTEIKNNLWRLKINGKWAKGFEYNVGAGTPLKIQVYNGNKPVEVIWSWSPNVMVYTKGIHSNITELDNIVVSRRTQGKGSVKFWTKDNPQMKMAIYLLPNE